jgi:hypothetical protein
LRISISEKTDVDVGSTRIYIVVGAVLWRFDALALCAFRSAFAENKKTPTPSL